MAVVIGALGILLRRTTAPVAPVSEPVRTVGRAGTGVELTAVEGR
jgi:hypothetical protein